MAIAPASTELLWSNKRNLIQAAKAMTYTVTNKMKRDWTMLFDGDQKHTFMNNLYRQQNF